VLFRGFLTVDPQVAPNAANVGNTRELGKLIYTQYVYAFEIAGVILLVAIVAAVALTLRRRKDSKYFDPAAAVKVKRSDRVRIVSMKAESERADNARPVASATEKK
jgi:NADH-quinone oxidoreductase subunit J